MKKRLCLLLAAVLFLSSVAYAKDKEYVSASDIQKVSLGDTFEQVTATVGEPQQVLSKELTSDGKEQVVWLYETIKPFKEHRDPFGRTLSSATAAALASYQQLRIQNPPYLVIFINGKAARIDRQKVESVPTAQVNVQSY